MLGKVRGKTNASPLCVLLPVRPERADELIALEDPADFFMIGTVEAARQGIAVCAATEQPILHGKPVPGHVGIRTRATDIDEVDVQRLIGKIKR